MKDSITHDQSYSISKLWIFKTVEQSILINWSSSLIIYLYISSGNRCWYSPLISLLCSPLISIRYSSLITLRYSSLIVMSGNTHHHSTNSDRRRTTDLPEVWPIGVESTGEWSSMGYRRWRLCSIDFLIVCMQSSR